VEAIGRRERTVAELSQWLAARGFDRDVAAGAVERLTELGELDDERFAHRYAEDKRELRGWGTERIREALAHRGVESAVIEAAVAAQGDEDEVERATGLLADRDASVETEPERARALAFLARRGYELEVAYEAVRRHEREAA
jgi:regulatory protein